MGEFVSPPEFYTQLTKNLDGTFTLRYRGGTVKKFDTDGKVLEIRDRNDNLMTFHYEDPGFPKRLTRVNDTLGRDIVYHYIVGGVNDGRLMEIEDFIGRKVTFTYDSKGDLVEVTSPAVTGTPNGNDFPDGKTARYTYSSGFSDDRLNHNLLTVTRPNEVAAGGPPVLTNKYGTNPNAFDFDKVIEQTYGGTNASGVPAGGTYTYTYTQLNAGVQSDDPNLPVSRTRETDRNGNVTEYEYNRLGYPVVRREFTRGLRAGEPAFYETRMVYNADGRLFQQIYPVGNRVEYTYDEGNPDRSQQGNLLREIRIPDAGRGGDQATLTTTYTYEPNFNKIKTITDPRGNDPTFVPPNGGPTSPARYTTTYTYDASGNLLQVQAPTVTLLNGSPQTIITDYTYNSFGQMTSEIDPEGNVDEYFYFPENDPDGDGDTSPGTRPGLNTTTGGYLKERITDSTTSPRRIEPTPPVQIRTQYFYDAVGNTIRTIDGRGIQTTYRVNQLNQVVQTIRASALPGVATAAPPEPMSLTAFAYIDNTFYDFNDNVVRREVEDRGNTSNTGGSVDATYKYDILDHPIEMSAEVDATKTLVTRYRYDANENRTLTIYPEGNADSAVYDERDLLFRSTRGDASFVRPGGAGTVPSTTTYNYDQNQNLIEGVDAEPNGGTSSTIAGVGDVTKFTYDGYDRRRTVADALGNVTTYVYDPASNVIRGRSDGEPVNDVAGDSGNRTLTVAEYIYDELSRVFVTHQALFQTPDATPTRTPTLTDTPAMDSLAVYLSDASSDAASVPGAVGIAVTGRVSTLTGYDRSSRVVFTIQDDLDAYRTDYDGADRVVKTVDSAISNGFSGSVFNPANVSGNTVETAYDDNSNVIERLETDVTTASGVANEVFRTTYLYDSLDRLQTVVDNVGQTEDYRYDSRSNLVARADAVGPITGRTINRRGLGSTASVSVNDLGNVTRTRYDGLSRTLETEAILTASGVGDGTHIGATLEGVLDTPPTPDTSQSGDGLISVYYSYDDNSQLLALRDDDGNTTAYIYDNQNRTITERKGLFVGGTNFAITGGDSGAFNVSLRGGVPPVDTEPTGTDIAYAYDRDSNVSTLTDEAGNVFACAYDALNRKKSCAITRAAGFIGTTGQTWEYDGFSRMTLCFDNNEGGTADDVTCKYFYDSLSRKVEETQQIGALSAKATSSNFDIAQSGAVGQYSATIYPDGRRVDSTYDTLDRLLSHRDNGQGSNIGAYTYIGKWRVLTLDYQNGTRLTHLNGTNDVGF
ncbi:RHS repeat protein, partial [Candidatus Poribacteria bacterium]|nr:RHS repeat protein [Candidatus Poribacteria bacterium]